MSTTQANHNQHTPAPHTNAGLRAQIKQMHVDNASLHYKLDDQTKRAEKLQTELHNMIQQYDAMKVAAEEYATRLVGLNDVLRGGLRLVGNVKRPESAKVAQ